MLKYLTILLFLATILSLALPFLKPGLLSGHDIVAHSTRAKATVEALKEGQFPVRWIGFAFAGNGAPLFNYYQVGFYYLVALFSFVLPLTTAIKVIVIFSWWLIALGAYLLAKRFGLASGLLAALLMSVAPYPILVIFVRAAYPELLGIGLSLITIYLYESFVKTHNFRYLFTGVITGALLLITHLPTALIFAPIGGLLVARALSKRPKTVYLPLLVGLSLNIGLAAFYVLPAISELPLINYRAMAGGRYYFAAHFITPLQTLLGTWSYGVSKMGPNDQLSFALGLFSWISLLGGLLTLILTKKTKHSWLIIWLAIALTGFFFSFETSLAFWQGMSFLPNVQYPWRFLMVIVVAAAMIGARLLKLIGKPAHQYLVLLLVLVFTQILYRNHLKPQQYLPQDYLALNRPWQAGESRLVDVESAYLPINAVASTAAIPTHITVIENKAHRLKLNSALETPATISVNRYYFPGWLALVDNKEVPGIISDSGLIAISLPAGNHQIEIRFTNTPIRKISNLISLMSLVALFTWVLKYNYPAILKNHRPFFRLG